MSKTSKWDAVIKEIFSEKETFISATELNDLLCKRFPIKRDYARQIIKRATDKKLIKSSDPFKFKNGQYVYMGNNDRFNLETLIKICKTYKPSMYRVLSLLNKEDRILSYYEARKAAATPVDNLDKYNLVQFDEEIRELINHDILFTVKDPEKDILYVASKEYEDSSMLSGLMKRHFEKMRLDSLFLPDIIRWLKEHNFINHNQVVYRRIDNPTHGAKHNDFFWDAFAYTNTTGFSINTGQEDKQTLVVLDVLIHREYSKEDLDSFYSRIQSVRHSTHGEPRKIMPIIFYVEVDPNVKREMQRLKLLNFSLQNIFGTKITEVIQKLDDIQVTLSRLVSTERSTEEVTTEVIENAENTLKTLDDTGHIENFQNIKGDLFESLMYVIVLNLFPYNARIRHSEVIKPYEYDIIVELDDEIIVIELKGFQSKTIINLGDNKTKNTVKWFFGKTFPNAKQAYTMPNSPFKYDKSKIKACYITSANFSDDAEAWLEQQNKTKLKSKRLDCYYDRKSLLRLVKTHENLESIRNSTNFVYLLERYYLKAD